jgi:hypothetical protein
LVSAPNLSSEMIGLGIELGCDVSQLVGGVRRALCDSLQLDSRHPQERNHLLDGAVCGSCGISAADRLFGLGHLVSSSLLSIRFQHRSHA